MEVYCVNARAKGIVKVGKYCKFQSFGRTALFYDHAKFIR